MRTKERNGRMVPATFQWSDLRAGLVVGGIISAMGLVVGGIVGLCVHLATVECEHLETAMERPTRLDVWGDGCMVTLADGTELPVDQYHVEVPDNEG